MTNNPKISIIIPVYGVERHIAKCIESIKFQTFTDFEAILINDGTKDNSVTVAEDAIDGDSRFIILHKDNGGQGSARNMGLDHARGDYIAFIDSDDYVEPRFLQAMYEKIITEDADICTCDVRLLSPEGSLEKEFVSRVDKYKETNDILNSGFFISNWFWDKLYRKNVFAHYRFDLNVRTFEDAHLLFRVVYGNKLTSVDEYLYNYIQHQGSTSNDLKPSYLQDRVAVKNKQLEFAKEHGVDDAKYLLHVYLKTFVFFCITTFSRYSKNYSKDIKKLRAEVDADKFTFKNILFMIKKEKKTGLSLLLFKISPQAFRLFARFWFRNHAA